ncbi:MAG TPA: hypothetical protein VNX25_01940, partial [Verrucomicrobiae bacterium]|nr:hypothetical protein [Verrucomicrobiae bacterium]
MTPEIPGDLANPPADVRPQPRTPRKPGSIVPAELGADLSVLPASEGLCLAKLVGAAQVMDGIFLRQVW